MQTRKMYPMKVAHKKFCCYRFRWVPKHKWQTLYFEKVVVYMLVRKAKKCLYKLFNNKFPDFEVKKNVKVLY